MIFLTINCKNIFEIWNWYILFSSSGKLIFGDSPLFVHGKYIPEISLWTVWKSWELNLFLRLKLKHNSLLSSGKWASWAKYKMRSHSNLNQRDLKIGLNDTWTIQISDWSIRHRFCMASLSLHWWSVLCLVNRGKKKKRWKDNDSSQFLEF